MSECRHLFKVRHEYQDQVFTFHFPSELWASLPGDDFATSALSVHHLMLFIMFYAVAQ